MLTEQYKEIAENIRNHNQILSGMAENIRSHNQVLSGYEDVVENLQNNNKRMEIMQDSIDMQKVKILLCEKRIAKFQKIPSKAGNIHLTQNENDTTKQSGSHTEYEGIDYFDFENHFRGSWDDIKKRQEIYLSYYEGKQNVIDLGCGRGEFLSLLTEHNIDAQGVDNYPEFVEMCKLKNLKITEDDAIHFLSTQKKTGGIFAGQLIEHLTITQIVELCQLAYEKLESGSSIIMETPNPRCLSIYTNAFYMDPSHQKPLHPFTMQYIVEKAGFTKVEILYTDASRSPVSIPKLQIADCENLDAFNNAMAVISEMLFGSQDYAIVGTK